MDLFTNGPSGAGPEWVPTDEMLKAIEASGARMLDARKEHHVSTAVNVQSALKAIKHSELSILNRFDPHYAAVVKEAAALESPPGVAETLSSIYGKEIAERALLKMSLGALLTNRAETYFQTRESYQTNGAQLAAILNAPILVANVPEGVRTQLALIVQTWKEEFRRIADLDPTLVASERVIARIAQRVDEGDFINAISVEGYRAAIRAEFPTRESFDAVYEARKALTPQLEKAKGELIRTAIDALEEARIASSEPEVAEAFIGNLTWMRNRMEKVAEVHSKLGKIERDYLCRALYGNA